MQLIIIFPHFPIILPIEILDHLGPSYGWRSNTESGKDARELEMLGCDQAAEMGGFTVTLDIFNGENMGKHGKPLDFGHVPVLTAHHICTIYECA
jgi:hypothetical protein